jgi:hypothetical protein
MSFDNTFLEVEDCYGNMVEISLREVSDQLNDLGYKIVNLQEYSTFMQNQLKQLTKMTQDFGGYDAED